MDEVYASVCARHCNEDCSGYVGASVTVIVRHTGKRIELLHHGTLRCGAELTEEQARILGDALSRCVDLDGR